jgi:hypothetical protein
MQGTIQSPNDPKRNEKQLPRAVRAECGARNGGEIQLLHILSSLFSLSSTLMISRSYRHILAQSQNCRSRNLFSAPATLPRPGYSARAMSATASRPDPFRPAKRVAGQRQDVWYAVSRNRLGRHTKWGLKVNRQRSRCSFTSSADCEHGPRVLVSHVIFEDPQLL